MQSSVSVAELELYVMHQPGALAQITNTIAQLHSNIQSVYTDPVMDRIEQKIRVRLTVRNREHLQALIAQLRRIASVRRVQRIG